LIKVLSLFSGIGGLCCEAIKVASLEDTFKIYQFVESNPFCQKVLQQNHPGIPIHTDIANYNPPELPEHSTTTTIICGGSPCQDTSRANAKGKGFKGERSQLWWEMYRIIKRNKPDYVIWENPDGARYPKGSDRISPLGYVIGSLAAIGYSSIWDSIKASDLGAPQIRERIFVIAYPNEWGSKWGSELQSCWLRQVGKAVKSSNATRNSKQRRVPVMADGFLSWLDERTNNHWKESSVPNWFVPAYSQTNRGKAIQAIGNSCCPQQAAIVWRTIHEVQIQRSEEHVHNQ